MKLKKFTRKNTAQPSGANLWWYPLWSVYEVPLDNNAAEQTIRPFCVGKKNWVMIDTIAGAESSAIIYSIAETAKVNNLKPYNYFEYLLEEIPKHMDDHDTSFCKDLLPWSDKLPAECRKQ